MNLFSLTAATHPVSPQEIVNRRLYIRKALKLWLYGTPSGQNAEEANADIYQVKFKQLSGRVEN